MTAINRRQKLEDLLQREPNDPFLLFGLAMEDLREGKANDGINRLIALAEAHPNYSAAYLQLGQALVGVGRDDEAKRWLEQGIAAAQRAGDTHAAGEMHGLLLTL